MEEKFEFKTIDNDEVLVKYTPLPQYDEGIYKYEYVITKDIFIACYERWIKNV